MPEHDPIQRPVAEQLPEADLGYSPWLGRRAVNLEQARVALALCITDESGEIADHKDRMKLERGASQVQSLTEKARHTLAEANSLLHGTIAASLALKDMPEVLHNMLLGNKTMPGANKWFIKAINSVPASRDWLTNRLLMHQLMAKKSDGSFIVSNETTLNVLQWHNHHMAQGQPAFERFISPYKQDFVDSVHGAAANGWLLPATVKNLDRLEKTGIYKSDGTDTHDNHWEGCMYMNPDGSYTVSLLPNKRVAKTLGHELIHVLEGVGRPDPETGVVPTNPWRHGLRRLVPENNAGMKILGELTTELAAVCLGRGVYPTRFALPKRDSYGWGLPLPYALTTAGKRPIAPSLFIQAHLEDDAETEARGPQSAMMGLRRAFREAFPNRDVIEDIASLQPQPEVKEPMRQPIMDLAKKLHESR